MDSFTKAKVERTINRITNKIDALKAQHGETPSLTHTYHGGWTLGYWQGKLSILEDILDDLNE